MVKSYGEFIVGDILYIRGLEGAFIKKPSLFSLVIILANIVVHMWLP